MAVAEARQGEASAAVAEVGSSEIGIGCREASLGPAGADGGLALHKALSKPSAERWPAERSSDVTTVAGGGPSAQADSDRAADRPGGRPVAAGLELDSAPSVGSNSCCDARAEADRAAGPAAQLPLRLASVEAGCPSDAVVEHPAIEAAAATGGCGDASMEADPGMGVTAELQPEVAAEVRAAAGRCDDDHDELVEPDSGEDLHRGCDFGPALAQIEADLRADMAGEPSVTAASDAVPGTGDCRDPSVDPDRAPDMEVQSLTAPEPSAAALVPAPASPPGPVSGGSSRDGLVDPDLMPNLEADRQAPAPAPAAASGGGCSNVEAGCMASESLVESLVGDPAAAAEERREEDSTCCAVGPGEVPGRAPSDCGLPLVPVDEEQEKLFSFHTQLHGFAEKSPPKARLRGRQPR